MVMLIYIITSAVFYTLIYLSSDYLVLVGRAAEDRMSTMWNKRQCTYNVNIEVRSCNNFCSGNPILVTYSERVSVALVIQHAKRMRRTVTRGRSGCTIFSTLSKKRNDFRGKNIMELKMCDLICCTIFTFINKTVKHNNC